MSEGTVGQGKFLALYSFVCMMLFWLLNFFMVYTLSATAEQGRAPDFDTSDDVLYVRLVTKF
jgi:hypothetical protein